ncbi:glycosyltransferase family 4 protein [Cerasicoccus fimbriatus]|uniref:glycosyltransferase family 4 protein n=1 Tax=Cerasicoccus fimbriatus TaxID=3014554 RepID=UPI0022B4196D|nr:glycosyltransferase family 4 protein [Cerasicoccus sp. TK19100]
MKRTITYITDLPHQPSGGGSFAVNWHAQEQLRRHFNVIAGPPITPKVSARENFTSKINRKFLKRPGKFSYFSVKTLDANARQVSAAIGEESDAVFFRSATRWCHSVPRLPYYVYLDVVFHTFFFNTFQLEDFEKSDLERIWAKEAEFLENAKGVFFESQWGLERAREAYHLTGDHYLALGRGGVLEPPENIEWRSDTLDFVTIAMHFYQKGGDLVAEAYRKLRAQHPEIRWHIIGGTPPDDVLALPGVQFHGKLRPDVDAERQTFREILANAFLLLHPTREDTNPLVITEAGYFGCPSISVNKFGIPELIIDGRTGILLDAPVSPDALATQIETLIQDRPRYMAMREEARAHALGNHTWGAIGDRLADVMSTSLDKH